MNLVELQLGDQGTNVNTLHNALLQLNYFISEEDQRQQSFGESTESAVRQFQSDNSLTTNGILDQATIQRILQILNDNRPWEVTGIIQSINGTPAVGVTVHLYDADNRQDTLLGTETTDEKGQYRIFYLYEDYRKTSEEIGGPDLFIMVFDQLNRQIGESRHKNDSQKQEVINLVIGEEFISKSSPNTDNDKERENIVRGKVLVRETGQGIRNLIVGLQEVDIAYIQNVANNNIQGDSLPDLQPWIFSLGSAITNEQGEFEIRYTDRDFIRGEGSEGARPDLHLIVRTPYSPTHDPNDPNQPFSPNPQPSTNPLEILFPFDEGLLQNSLPEKYFTDLGLVEGVLFATTYVRTEAASQEAFVISIQREFLKNAGVTYPGNESTAEAERITETTKDRRDQISTYIDSDSQFCADFKQSQYEKYKDKYQGRRSLIDDIRNQQFRDFSLSKHPPNLRQADTYLGPEDNLKSQHDNLIKSGLDAAPNKSMLISLSTEELESMGFAQSTEGGENTRSTQNDGQWEGSISFEEILQIKRITSSSTILTESVSLPEAYLAKHQAAFILGEILKEVPESTTSQTLVANTQNSLGKNPISTEQILGDLLDRQLNDMRGPETLVSLKGRNDSESLRENLNQLKVRSGPADKTSFHDFYNLQIAFEYIWTEIFDENIKGLGEDLYEEFVVMEHTYSGTSGEPSIDPATSPPVIEAQKDLDRLLGTINDAFKAISISNPPPEAVKRLVPEITSEKWNSLSPEDQARIVDLSDIV